VNDRRIDTWANTPTRQVTSKAAEVVSSTPTLFHSGTMHPQMSSCYLTTVQDDLVDIFKSYSKEFHGAPEFM
jgi:ribonucleotide reductase alpha subunit